MEIWYTTSLGDIMEAIVKIKDDDMESLRMCLSRIEELCEHMEIDFNTFIEMET